MPPCAYQGGKQRIAKETVDIIYQNADINENTKFYDLCCGSGSISIELINRCIYPVGQDPMCEECSYNRPYINTLEGKMYIKPDDYIITGIKGERYPCKKDIFEETYERVE